jgi:nitroreductase/NAD-dependent dihydropyrimidine dehydrogenase PreA subunit
MLTFHIDAQSCSDCGACLEVCPSLAFEYDIEGKVFFKPDYAERCIGCGHCMAVCKTKSVIAHGLDYEKDFFEFSEKDQFFRILEQRRSVRRFKPKPVDSQLIERILHAVTMAPHGDEKQHVEITIINDRDIIMDAMPLLAEFYDKLGKWLQNPFIRLIIRTRKGKATLNTLRNHLMPRIAKGLYRDARYEYDGITRGAHTMLIFHAPKDAEEHYDDSMIFATYAILTAEALGLGSTLIGLIPPALNKTPRLRQHFGIPAGNETVMAVILGYPKYRFQRGIKRELKKVHWI